MADDTPPIPASGAATSGGPVISRTEVTWRGEKLFEAGPAGRTHQIDAGAEVAPGPVETLLNALVTCAGVDIIDIIGKRRTPVARFSAQVAGRRRPQFPRRLLEVTIDLEIDGEGVAREHAERAVSLSFERYCSVASSLAPDIVFETRLTLNGEAGETVRHRPWVPAA